MTRAAESAITVFGMMKSAKRLFCSFWIFASASMIASAALQFDGTLERTVYGANETNTALYSFSASIDGCKWLLFTEYTGVQRAISGSEGDHIFTIVPQRMGTNAWVTNVGTIRPGPLYDGDYSPETALVWMAFGSACYFRTNQQADGLQRAFEISKSQGQITKFVFPSDVEVSDSVPGCLSRAVYFNDGKSPAAKPPYQDGYTNGIYDVTEFYEANGLKFPKRFVLEWSLRKNGATNRNDLDLVLRTVGQVTSVREVELKSFRPLLPPYILLNDQRFTFSLPAIRSVHYVVTNQTWLTDVDVKGLPEYSRQIPRKR